MSDIVLVALITAGSSALVSSIGYVVTYKAAIRHGAVELDRLRHERRDAERSNRQGTYHQLLAVLNRMDMYATGFPPKDDAAYEATLESFNSLFAGVDLFAPQSVRDSGETLTDVLKQVGADMDQLGGTVADRFARAFQGRRDEVTEATKTLTAAMRADITREILDE